MLRFGILRLGQPLSNLLRHDQRMKNRIRHLIGVKSERLITTFGQAKLVVTPDGSVELRGGHTHDRAAAKEWISLFMHEAVPRFAK